MRRGKGWRKWESGIPEAMACVEEDPWRQWVGTQAVQAMRERRGILAHNDTCTELVAEWFVGFANRVVSPSPWEYEHLTGRSASPLTPPVPPPWLYGGKEDPLYADMDIQGMTMNEIGAWLAKEETWLEGES